MPSQELELELLNLVISFKPTGIHRNFRLVNILLNSSFKSIDEITDVLHKFYDLSQVAPNPQEDDLFADREFFLPDHEFSSIIEEYRLQSEDDLSRDVSPLRSHISGSASKRDSTSSQSNQQHVSGKKRTTRNQSNMQRRETSKRKRSTHRGSL